MYASRSGYRYAPSRNRETATADCAHYQYLGHRLHGCNYIHPTTDNAGSGRHALLVLTASLTRASNNPATFSVRKLTISSLRTSLLDSEFYSHRIASLINLAPRQCNGRLPQFKEYRAKEWFRPYATAGVRVSARNTITVSMTEGDATLAAF